MKNGFTMIELIFVIVIIGILAAVAIPKLAATRSDAQAVTCTHEVSQFISEISLGYTRDGYNIFKDIKASKMTNILIADTIVEGNGIAKDAEIDGETGVRYYCDGQPIVSFKGAVLGGKYEMIVEVIDGITPASKMASEWIIKNVLSGSTRKVFEL